MPDVRRHRGAHPEDRQRFVATWHDRLRRAVAEYGWLLSRDYAEPSALKLVGDRYQLTSRQRTAVMRSSCSDQALARRRSSLAPLARCDEGLAIDGYNLLITIESALAGGLVLVGREGACRDLASLHGSYRKVDETRPALELIIDHIADQGIGGVEWLLDRPVSNSGRLKVLLAELLETRGQTWNIELVDDPDARLAASSRAVVSSDSWILDRCGRWVNLAAEIIDSRIRDTWKVDLRSSKPE